MPDRKYLFLEDKNKKENEKRKKEEIRRRKDSAKGIHSEASGLPFDINARIISFDSENNVINAEGDVIISYSSLVAEAQQGKVNMNTNEAELSGDVRITDVTADLLADSAKVNLDTGEASLRQANVLFTEGDYRLFAEHARREEGDVFFLEETTLSTCRCPDGGDRLPWSLCAEEAKITRDGYGQAWDAKLRVQDISVFYLPYFFFPAKTERQSGLLPATFGAGRQTGIELEVPFFWAISDSADMTITTVYESNVHYGVDLEWRKIFSRQNAVEAGLVYLDESMRGGDLLGTDTTGLADPTIDDMREAGYYYQNWQSKVLGRDLQLVVDGRYVGDTLFLREYDKPEIAPRNTRFVTSRGVLRTPLTDSFSAELSSEYNQSLVSNQDFVFQRLPELNINGVNLYRPFGENPLGLKLSAGTNLSLVNFSRDQSYDGTRAEFYERLRVPFYFWNYADGSLEGTVRATHYSMDENTIVDTRNPAEDDSDIEPEQFDSSSNRVVPGMTFRLNSVVEKVFNVTDGNLIKTLGEYGSIGRREQMLRVKHTIEPGIKYNYVPYVNQDDNPQYDSTDRLAEKSVFSYQLMQRLYARYDPRNEYIYGIEETTPEIDDMGSLESQVPIDQALTFGFEEDASARPFTPLRRGSVRELANFRVYQSYDMAIANDKDSPYDPLSDLGVELFMFPNEHAVMRAKTDFNTDDQEFSAYTLEGQFRTKRGDSLRSRFRFINDNVRQLESSAELRLTERLKLGHYTRYDDLTSSFIEQKTGLRISSACNCWIFDITLTDRINPNQTKLQFNITLIGLGEIGNTVFSQFRDERDS